MAKSFLSYVLFYYTTLEFWHYITRVYSFRFVCHPIKHSTPFLSKCGSCTAELEFESPNWVQAKATSDCLARGGQPPLTRRSEVAFFPALIYICQQTMETGLATSDKSIAWTQFGNSNSTSSNLKTRQNILSTVILLLLVCTEPETKSDCISQ